MQLGGCVLGQQVTTLEQAGDFKSILSYLSVVEPDALESLTMPFVALKAQTHADA